MVQPDRIDGWKAIGAHFGRDRTTVMRWAQSRGLPVRRLPGGRTATVYALRSELNQWARSHRDVLAESSQAQAVDEIPDALLASPPDRKRPSRRLLLAGIGLVVIAGTVGAGIYLTRAPDAAPPIAREDRPLQLPRNPDLSALYLQARDDWAERSAESLSRAVTAFETITRREPAFCARLCRIGGVLSADARVWVAAGCRGFCAGEVGG